MTEPPKPTPGPRLANHIEVRREGNTARIYIDGEEFPWATDKVVGWYVRVNRDEVPTLHVEILAHTIDVHNDIREAPE